MLQTHEQVGDVLLDQTIFAGVGNIIKNEVLFICKVHPETRIKNLAEKQNNLVDETRAYCLKFYEWKKKYELKKHWQIYRKRICPSCGSMVIRKKTGKRERLSHFCSQCQLL